MNKLISKSRYLSGLQCKKLLWHHFYDKASFPPVDNATQAVFDQGHEIGKLAHSLFPGGKEIQKEFYDIKGAVNETKNLLSENIPVFEAAFLFENAYARVDILNPAGKNEWDIVEVKSSTSVKDVNLHDLAIQKYILEGCGINVRRCILMHINNQYVRKGEINAAELFKLSDETERVTELAKNVKSNLEELQDAVTLKIAPDIGVGKHCSDPYECPLTGTCWSFLPEQHNVFSLVRAGKKAFELLESGVLLIKKIPEEFELNEKQKIQRNAVCSGEEYIDSGAIISFLKRLKAPYYFLDFETIMPGIPLFDNTRPYQQIPFQFSVFKTDNLKKAAHEISFLAEGKNDPRPALLEKLKNALGNKGSIICYNASFEKSRISEMAADFPDYKEWAEKMNNRIVDLLDPFSAFHYYHPDQNGSASFKAVLPVLTGMRYDNLEIGEGGTASREFLRITFSENINENETKKIRSLLLDYCRQDTFGMIEVLKRLVDLSGAKSLENLPKTANPSGTK